jgi:hypothetical protein
MNIAFLNTLFIWLMSLITFPEVSSDPGIQKNYPVPSKNENSLFYIQRTKNTNAIVYEVNRKADGKINSENPVKIYWIRYSSDSTKEDLTPIQSRYAYGIVSRNYNNQKNAFVLQIVSYKKRNIFLLPTPNEKHYVAFMSINGKLAELQRIFVATNGGTFWFPVIEYIELLGKDPVTHQTVMERFKP